MIDILREVPVYENKFGILYDDDVRFPSGTLGRYLRFSWTAPYTVAILAVLRNGDVVLLRAFRHAVRRSLLEVPKGFGSSEELPSVAATRELREETGLEGVTTHLATVYADPGFIREPTHLFLASQCEWVRKPAHEVSEVLSGPQVFRRIEIKELMSAGAIEDALTALLLSRFLALPDPAMR